jgi:hypothetical protein
MKDKFQWAFYSIDAKLKQFANIWYFQYYLVKRFVKRQWIKPAIITTTNALLVNNYKFELGSFSNLQNPNIIL